MTNSDPTPIGNEFAAKQKPLGNVLLWYWGRRGGGARFTHYLARELAQNLPGRLHLSLSRQSDLFADTDGLGVPGCHVDTYRSPASAIMALTRVPQLRRRFARYIKDHNIDVVVSAMAHILDPVFVPVVRRTGARFIMTVHDAVPHPGEGYGVRGRMLGHAIRRADGIMTLSGHVGQQLTDIYGYPTARQGRSTLGVFPYGAETHAPKSFPRGRPFRFLFFGRLLPYKGLDLLAQAFSDVRAHHHDVELHIIGQGNPRMVAAFQDMPGVRIENRWVKEDEIAACFAGADAVVLPYVEASQSGVVPIAAARGIPIVATPVGGLAEQVQDGKTGVIAAAVSASALQDAMAALLAGPHPYDALSAGGLDQAKTTFSWPRIADQYLDLVSRVRALPPYAGGR